MIKLKKILKEQRIDFSKTKKFADDTKSKGTSANKMLNQKIADKKNKRGYTLFTNGTISKVVVEYDPEAEFDKSSKKPHMKVIITNNTGKSMLGKNWAQKALTPAQGGTDKSPNATADNITAYYIKQLLPWINQANKNDSGSAANMENEVKSILTQSGLSQSIANFVNSLRIT